MSIGYSTEITLEQYQLLEDLLPPKSETGRPRTVNLMLVIQGILFVLGSGCAWRLMPKEYPHFLHLLRISKHPLSPFTLKATKLASPLHLIARLNPNLNSS
jgi:hypothetical protein